MIGRLLWFIDYIIAINLITGILVIGFGQGSVLVGFFNISAAFAAKTS